MAKKWEPPYQDCQPVIGLGYLEKNYGKDATEITEISLEGLLQTFFRLTAETSDNTLCLCSLDKYEIDIGNFRDFAKHLLCNALDTSEIFGRYFGFFFVNCILYVSRKHFI